MQSVGPSPLKAVVHDTVGMRISRKKAQKAARHRDCSYKTPSRRGRQDPRIGAFMKGAYLIPLFSLLIARAPLHSALPGFAEPIPFRLFANRFKSPRPEERETNAWPCVREPSVR